MLNTLPQTASAMPLGAQSTAPAAVRRTPLVIAAIGGCVLFVAAVVRHTLLRSGGYDLSIFDQSVYLLSQGQAPFSTLIGMHILADHVSLILYPVALLYRIFPSVYWLFAVQTLAIAGGVVPLYHLCRQQNLRHNQAIGVSIAYLLYPVTIFASLFDFNPSTIAVPFLLGSVYFARERKLPQFIGCIAVVMACRDASALTVIFLGIWLLGFEKRYRAGAIALVSGLAWFVLSTKLIGPLFVTPGTVSTVDSVIVRSFGYLGSSMGEVLTNFVLRPDRWIGHLFQASTLKYLVVLILPLAWGLSPRYLAPMIGAAPTLVMNLLAEEETLRSLTLFYDLPILVFIFIAVIGAIAAQVTWLQRGRTIACWAAGLILLGGGLRLATSNLGSSFNGSQFAASYGAIAQIQPTGAVLTNHGLAPQISHRSVIHVYPVLPNYRPVFAQVASLKHLTVASDQPLDVSMYNQVLLRLGHTDADLDRETAHLIAQMQGDRRFDLGYGKADVYLFNRRPNS
jgi:uncharacterized membrane protein